MAKSAPVAGIKVCGKPVISKTRALFAVKQCTGPVDSPAPIRCALTQAARMRNTSSYPQANHAALSTTATTAATGTPCADRARQPGATQKRSRWASMNAQISLADVALELADLVDDGLADQLVPRLPGSSQPDRLDLGVLVVLDWHERAILPK